MVVALQPAFASAAATSAAYVVLLDMGVYSFLGRGSCDHAISGTRTVARSLALGRRRIEGHGVEPSGEVASDAGDAPVDDRRAAVGREDEPPFAASELRLSQVIVALACTQGGARVET